MSQPDFGAVNARILGNYLATLQQWFPNGQKLGPDWCVGSLAGEPGKSLKIHVRKGVWKDFNSGEGGSDPVSLYAALHNLTQAEAARRLDDSPTPRRQAVEESDGFRPLTNPPKDLPAPGIEFGEQHAYKTADGRLLGFVVRTEGDEGKTFRPRTPWLNAAGEIEWRWKAFAAPRPLYGLQQLAAHRQAVVVVVEGEKCADALERALRGTPVLTWPGGANAASQANWEPLRGRRVVLWPDADEPGHRAMQQAGKALVKLGCSVKAVTPPQGVEKGWDAADAVKEGWDEERIGGLLGSAREFVPDETQTELGLNDTPLSFPPPKPFSDFEPSPDTPIIVEGGLIQKGMLTMLSAPAKARKSWLLYDLAISIATGKPWLGRHIVTRGSVLFIDLEIQPSSLEKRFLTIARKAGVNPGGKLEVCKWRHLTAQKGITADTAAAEIIRILAERSFDVVIVDSVYLLLDGDESDPLAVGNLMKAWVNVLKTTGAAVVYSHHYTKGSNEAQAAKRAMDRASGSAWWSRFADVLIPLTPPVRGQNPENRELLVAEPECRHHLRPAPIVLEWNADTLTFFPTTEDAVEMLRELPKKDQDKKTGKHKADPKKVASCLQSLDRLTQKASLYTPEKAEDQAELNRIWEAVLSDDENERENLPVECWVPRTKWEAACQRTASGEKFSDIVERLIDDGKIHERQHDGRLYYRSKVAIERR